jgi:hypothetical protein
MRATCAEHWWNMDEKHIANNATMTDSCCGIVTVNGRFLDHPLTLHWSSVAQLCEAGRVQANAPWLLIMMVVGARPSPPLQALGWQDFNTLVIKLAL